MNQISFDNIEYLQESNSQIQFEIFKRTKWKEFHINCTAWFVYRRRLRNTKKRDLLYPILFSSAYFPYNSTIIINRCFGH
jgi:hypothetical protein